MKKWFGIFLAVMLLATFPALALTDAQRAQLATDYLPQGAVFIKEETEEDALILCYASADQTAEYDLTTDESGKLLALSYDLSSDEGGASSKLTESEAKASVLALYPDAAIQSAVLEKEDQRYAYEITFTTAQWNGMMLVNAETGAVMEYEVLAQSLFDAQSGATSKEKSDASSGATGKGKAGSGKESADVAEILSARHPGATVLECELDDDDGVRVYEGDAKLDGKKYEFKINAQTGELIKWKLDD